MALVNVKTWGGININDGINYSAAMNVSTGLPTLSPQMTAVNSGGQILSNMAYSMRVLSPLEITIVNQASKRKLRARLHQMFDSQDGTPKRLVVADLDGVSNKRFVTAVCAGMVQKQNTAGEIYVITLVQDGLSDRNYRWRRIATATDTWSITASGQQKTLVNEGDDLAFPIMTITPTTASGAGYQYKQWVAVRWRVDAAYTDYPYDIGDDSFDTAALVTAGKMQAGGDDLRVKVSGVEVDRWLDGINTTTTKVWCNLSFAPRVELTTVGAIASTGQVGLSLEGNIDFNESTANLPSSGIVMIDSEAFVYTGKNDSQNRITGITRASRGTSLAAHSAGATAWWVQNDVYIIYGNTTAAAPAVDSTKEPSFEVSTSTNTFWDYNDAGGTSTVADWDLAIIAETTTGLISRTDIGAYVAPDDFGGTYEARTAVYNPCLIVSANFTNGIRTTGSGGSYLTKIQSSTNGSTYTDEYTITAGTWNQNETLAASSTYVALYVLTTMLNLASGPVEITASDVALTLNSSNTPTIANSPEENNYTLSLELENLETAVVLDIDHDMVLNDELEVNTDDKTVTDLGDGSSQLQARTLVGGVRADWLTLVPGENIIENTGVFTGNVTIDFEWYERVYY